MRKPLLNEESAGLLLVTGVLSLFAVIYAIPFVYMYYSDLVDLWTGFDPVAERIGRFLVFSAVASSAFLMCAYARFVDRNKSRSIAAGLMVSAGVGPLGAAAAAIWIYSHLPSAEQTSMLRSSVLLLLAVLGYCGLIFLFASKPAVRRRSIANRC